ncbi:MAG: glycosyltransferase family 4 protein [Chitinophagaceae bacterium]
MSDKTLHIICLDVPYPVDHGGMFDLFYKLKALRRAGVRIHLHCFEYGRGQQPALNEYCETVHYYKRRTGVSGLSLGLPYIVSSRRDEELTERLLQDNHPILFEGIHCSWLVNDDRFRNRKLVVRLHNVEYQYYRQLSMHERSPLKKIYYTYESRLLKKYEAGIADKAQFLTVSEPDAVIYRNEFDAQASFLPVFLPWDTVEALPGSGQFCLYHGNLSVAENEEAAIWLLKEVFAPLKTPLVIAGKNPSRRLMHLAHASKTCCVAANPGELEMQDLISKAHINILPSLNTTGVKLKLLNALFVGRHCITNRHAMEATGIEACCDFATTADDMQALISSLMELPFTDEMIKERAAKLGALYDNKKNAELLSRWIW